MTALLSKSSNVKGRIPRETAALDASAHAPAGQEQSGLCLLSDNPTALAARALSANDAKRSLDLMYYLWHDDSTGRHLARTALDAAARGVRVRILLDDVSPRDNDALIHAIGGHANVEIRLFNRSWVRHGWLLHRIELVMRRSSMTRRMHNKAWIVDGKLAIVGGRNIGDAYFGAADTNFRDLDVLISGRAVQDAQQIFERFWSCEAARPIPSPSSRLSPEQERIAPAATIASPDAKWTSVRDLIDDAGRMHWTDEARIVSDPPRKVKGDGQKSWLIRSLLPVIKASRARLEIISPYFIPGRRGVQMLRDLHKSGAQVTVLTNSLAATDVAAVHGAYGKYRRRLLSGGIKLYELQRHAEPQKLSVLGSKGASLHTKAFTVDDNVGFVGSFNFDPRSTSLNTEMGILFRQSSLVADMRRLFSSEISPDVSYSVSLSHGRLLWEGRLFGVAKRFRSEPEAGYARRLIAFVIRFLPVESEL